MKKSFLESYIFKIKSIISKLELQQQFLFMKLSGKLNFLFFSYPFIFIALLLIISQSDFFSYDILQFKLAHKGLHKILIFSFVLVSSLIFFLMSDYWKKLSLDKKLLMYGLSTMLVAFFFRINTSYVFSGIFAVTGVYYALSQKKTYKPEIFQYIFIVYFVIQAVSLLWTTNFIYGISLLGHYTPFVVSVLMFSLFRLTKKDFDLILLLLFRISIFIVTISLFSWLIQARIMKNEIMPDELLIKYSGMNFPPYIYTFAWSDYYHPTYISIVLLISLFSGWYYLNKPETENRIQISEFLYYLGGLLLLFLYTSSRFMLLGWILINTLGILYLLRNNKRILIPTLLVIFAGMMIVFVLYSASFERFYKDPVRIAHFQIAFQSISENTWHGTGIGGLTKYINSQNPAYKSFEFYPSFTHIHPHNQFVGDLMQTGVFGLTGIIVMVLFLFYVSFKNKNWLLFAFLSLTVFLMMVEMPLIYEKGALIFSVIVSLLMQWKNNEENLTENF